MLIQESNNGREFALATLPTPGNMLIVTVDGGTPGVFSQSCQWTKQGPSIPSAADGSGIREIYYSFGPFVFGADGLFHVAYFSGRAAGTRNAMLQEIQTGAI